MVQEQEYCWLRVLRGIGCQARQNEKLFRSFEHEDNEGGCRADGKAMERKSFGEVGGVVD
jgi:hypothetical protein